MNIQNTGAEMAKPVNASIPSVRPDATPAVLAIDLASGLAIAAPVYWMFTKFLAINLPGLTNTGWI